MLDLIPALLVLVCSEGYSCENRNFERHYLMPSWEICQASAKGASLPNPTFAESEHAVTVVCVGLTKAQADAIN